VTERWVIDASVGLAWVHPAQATEESDALLQQLKRGITVVVPGLWFQEMANSLLVLEWRKGLKANERREALVRLCALNTRPDFEGASLAFGKVSELGELHRLSIYDATYLELVLREQTSLRTRDQPLQRAAKDCGVPLLLK
jgi:predicted nucleic acid-binding protein